MTTLAAPPTLTVTPKVVLGNGTVALLATSDGDRLVRTGTVLTLNGEAVRVESINGSRGSWAVGLTPA